MELPERFLKKISKNEFGCWEWTAALTGSGYGNFRMSGRNYTAHRLAYEALVGPIEKGLELDHLCRNRKCCNPEHLEPVTHAENQERGLAGARQVCGRGHQMTAENIYIYKGNRWCRKCQKIRQQRRYSTPEAAAKHREEVKLWYRKKRAEARRRLEA